MKHNNVKGKNINTLDFFHEKKGDILEYERPILSHFVNKLNPDEQYIYHWVDSNDFFHRWLVFKVTDNLMLDFFKGLISLKKIILNNSEVILMDLDANLKPNNIMAINLQVLPNDYLPENNYLFVEDRYTPYAIELKKSLIQKIIKKEKNTAGINKFGGFWTKQKIDVFIKYLKAYIDIMKKQSWAKNIYFDGFAGSGEIEYSDGEDIIEGVAPRVVETDEEGIFNYYYMVELDREKADGLKNILLNKFPNKKKNIKVVSADCNQKLIDFSNYLRKDLKLRGLAFVDPFKMSVEWKSLESFKDLHVDLWILVPTGVDANRKLRKDNTKISDEDMRKLEIFLGMEAAEIQSYFYKEKEQRSLFEEDGSSLQKLENTTEKIAELYVKKMKQIWKYVSKPMPLKNTTGATIFHFIFASQVSVAQKIANEIIGKEMNNH